MTMDARELGNAVVATSTYAEPARYHEMFARLRRERPVAWMEPDGYEGFWAVSKLKDIQEVELNARLFVNAPRSVLRSEAMNDQVRAVNNGRPFMFHTLTTMDAETHTQYRRLTQSWFLPAKVKALEADIRQLANDYIDKMVAMGGTCDFARDIAVWFPLRVIMRILGVPPEDEPMMLLLTQQIFGPDDPDIKDSEFKGDLVETVKSFFGYFRDLNASRRSDPRDDVSTVLATSLIDGEPVPEHEALSYYILIATAGHDTTSSTLSGGMLALMQNPDQYRALRERPEELPRAIDEMLRWVSPVTHFFRTATQDYDLRGQKVRAGDSLLMCYPSANRDEEIFEHPFRFDIGRPPNKHVAFGYGPHVCLGQFLAKLELRVFLEEFLRRIEHVEVAGEPAWLAANFVGGLKRLPMRFTAAT